MNQFARTQLLIKEEGMNLLQQSTVAVFGLGGVGSYVIEALARSGIGHLIIIDDDIVSLTNINRQLIATWDTIGQKKVDVATSRLLSINPQLNITPLPIFIQKDSIHTLDLSKCDYIVDAVDTVTAKLLIIEQANKLNIPVISSMGTGNKLDPSKLCITMIEDTEICPLAKVMRKELRRRKISNVKVVYSTEYITPPDLDYSQELKGKEKQIIRNEASKYQKITPGSTSFVPGAAGLLIAGEVINTLLKNKTIE